MSLNFDDKNKSSPEGELSLKNIMARWCEQFHKEEDVGHLNQVFRYKGFLHDLDQPLDSNDHYLRLFDLAEESQPFGFP